MKTWEDLAISLIARRYVSARAIAGTTDWEFSQTPDGAVTVRWEGALSGDVESFQTIPEFAQALNGLKHWGAWLGEAWALEAGFHPGFAVAREEKRSCENE